MTENENNPMTALEAGVAVATMMEPIVSHEDGRKHLVVPDGYRIEDITDPDRLVPHIDQMVTVDDRASLSAYANRFSDTRSILIADYDSGQICAHLDWHGSNSDKKNRLQRQHCRHEVTLVMRNSEEYRRWSEMEGKLHSQEDFALFVEENVSDVTDPDHSVLVEICRELEATQGVSFKSGIRLENGDRTFRYEDETRVVNELQVPTEIRLSIPPYHGEEPIDIRAKFRFRVAPDGLRLGFNWHRVEYQRRATFFHVASQAAEETGLPVFYGRVG